MGAVGWRSAIKIRGMREGEKPYGIHPHRQIRSYVRWPLIRLGQKHARLVVLIEGSAFSFSTACVSGGSR
jgi:hypothetical protein